LRVSSGEVAPLQPLRSLTIHYTTRSKRGHTDEIVVVLAPTASCEDPSAMSP